MNSDELIVDPIFYGIWLIDNFISESENRIIIESIENLEFKKAYQFTNGRNNFEVNFENDSIYNLLLKKIKRFIFVNESDQEIFKINNYFKVIGAFKYFVGNYITPHADAPINLKGEHTSLSLIIYLNDDFSGGETLFNKENVSITPIKNRALFFLQEKSMIHEGRPVINGTKFILRLDCYKQIL